MNQSSPYLLQIQNQNHPFVHQIAREKGKKFSCICGKTFSSAIPQTSWELPGECLKEVYFFAKIYSQHS